MLDKLRLALAAALMLSGVSAAQTTDPAPTPISNRISLQFVQDNPPPNYDTAVLDPLHKAQSAAEDACKAPGDVLKGYQCIMPPPPVTPSTGTPQMAASITEANLTSPVEPQVVGGLIGSVGWSTPWGNCVLEPGVNNPGWGNPIDWPATSSTPWLGASVLFYFNHVAVVTGIYPDGSVEVAQENAPGMPHHIPASMIRGYR